MWRKMELISHHSFNTKELGEEKSELKQVQKITSSGVLFIDIEGDYGQTKAPFWISKVTGNQEITPKKIVLILR
ncbi:hypothetical protein [Mycoplasma ovis]|uniref:hypothetical protein n=1 Tax=Mycoplasma ovis TaxID=171632 RepID=UPI00118317F0|nr:hypothetical protein [Mycoplasma ovis]